MNQSLAVLRECADRIEAETIRIRLASEGITAFITSAEAAFAMGMGAPGPLRLVRVEVSQDDLQDAMDLLEADAARMHGAEPWICSRCRENNDAPFEICWSCSKPRDEDDQKVPSDEPESKNSISVQHPTAIKEDMNPYRPVMLGEEAVRVVSNGTVKDRVDRAFRASIIGAFLFPPILNLYSVYCLVDLVGSGVLSDPRFSKRMLITLVINFVVIVMSLVFWLRLI